tara:strand:+ start:47 stop:460 length:414 start_codon:yes stop_codon:yes gene_type:complete
MADSVKNGVKRGGGRDGNGRFTSENTGRPKGAKSKFTTLKNEFVKVFEQHGGPARLAELMAKSPEKYFEFLVRLQPREIVADVTTSHQPTIAAPPAAPESLSEWMERKDDMVEALPQEDAVDALVNAEVSSNGHGSN